MAEQLLTYDEAAEVLGSHVSLVPKLVRRGVLTSHGRRGQRGSIDRVELERVAAERAQAAVELERRRAEARQPARPRTPDVDHEWLTPDQAGALIGMTGQGIRKRCHRGTIPHRKVGRQYWIRADHASLAAHVRATDGPENMTIALDGIDRPG